MGWIRARARATVGARVSPRLRLEAEPRVEDIVSNPLQGGRGEHDALVAWRLLHKTLELQIRQMC